MPTLMQRMSDTPRSITPSKGVCRCLFGRPDHDQTKQWLEENISKQREAAADRWNFDFQKGIPKPGRFEWLPVDANSNVPAAYGATGIHLVPVGSTNEPTIVNNKPEDKNDPEPSARPTRQAPITDFMKKKKRKTSANKTDSPPSKTRTLSPVQTSSSQSLPHRTT